MRQLGAEELLLLPEADLRERPKEEAGIRDDRVKDGPGRGRRFRDQPMPMAPRAAETAERQTRTEAGHPGDTDDLCRDASTAHGPLQHTEAGGSRRERPSREWRRRGMPS